MFYDSYMANNDSDLKYRLGKVSSVVPKTYKVQTTSNFKTKFNVETGYGKIKISNQYFLNPLLLIKSQKSAYNTSTAQESACHAAASQKLSVMPHCKSWIAGSRLPASCHISF